MSDVVLEADKLSKFFRHDWTYSRRTVLQEVSFSVTRGQAFGFVGPNGAGKTTTIKILLDLVRPSSGAVRLFGLSPHERKVREKIGFLPERPYLYDHLTATETLHLYGGLLGLGGAHLGKRTTEMLELVDLRDTGKTKLKSFSKGMLQRLGLAQALLGKPELVILDEPMSGLDPIGRRDVRDILFRLNDEGTTVFFSSHILSDVESICDAVAMIFKGRIHVTGRVDELLQRGGAEQTEIVVRAQERERLPEGLQFTHAPSGDWLTVVQAGQANEVLRALLERRVEVVSLARKRRSLEDEFLRGVESTS